MDIHEYGNRLGKCLKAWRAGQRPIMEKFLKDLEASGMSKGRIVKYNYTLKTLYRLSDSLPFSKWTAEAAKELVRKVEAQEYTAWTKHDFRLVIKKFSLWLNQNYDKKIDLSWLKITTKNNTSKLPDELLTQEEVQKIVDTCDNSRDKALVSLMYDSGCRIGEILGLKLKHVTFDKYGAVMMVDGKTGQRRVRVISSASLLAAHIETHPFKNNPESYLWLTKFNRKGENKTGWNPIIYKGVSVMLKNLCKKAGMTKRVYPHLFRHSRATNLANKLTEAQMKEHFGWVQSSDMASVYVHMSGRDVDDALLKAYGMKPVDGNEEQAIKPAIYPRCKELNSTLQKLCKRCACPLSETEAMEADGKTMALNGLIMDFMEMVAEENPRIKQKFKEMVKQKQK